MHEELVTFTVIGLLLALGVLVNHPRVHQAALALLSRWGPRLIARLNPPPEVDQLVLDLQNTMRRERLRADIRRLEHLLATDEWMSGTRQMGNRLAYAWVVREFDRVTDDLSPMFLSGEMMAGGSLFDAPSATRSLVLTPAVQHAPKVEILEIGWRR